MHPNKVEICGVNTSSLPLLKEEEKDALFERIKAGDEAAKEEYIRGNLRLVLSVIKRFSGSNENADDLFQIGCIGLIKAVNTFHVDRGSRLATHAAKCIENEILMLLRASKKYSREVSLFEPIGIDKDGEAVTLVDVIEMDNKEMLDDLILSQEVVDLYEAYEACLKDQEKEVIGMRYGLFGRQPKTQREIAAELGISRSYVSRIEKKALGKLRQRMELL